MRVFHWQFLIRCVYFVSLFRIQNFQFSILHFRIRNGTLGFLTLFWHTFLRFFLIKFVLLWFSFLFQFSFSSFRNRILTIKKKKNWWSEIVNRTVWGCRIAMVGNANSNPRFICPKLLISNLNSTVKCNMQSMKY